MRFSGFLLCVISMASVLLVSCAPHSSGYLKKGRQINPIVVPPGVPMVKQDTYYPVPNNPQPLAQKSVSIIPPTFQENK